MIYSKVSYGYVSQSYDSETGDCVQQSFIADGHVQRVDENANPIAEDQIDELANTEKECPMDMVQP